MKKEQLLFIGILVIMSMVNTSLVYGQKQLLGEWTNSYNSLLTITQQNPDGSLIGSYSSTTGSSGTFQVVGYYLANPENGNIAVTLLVSWNSLDDSTKDPTQFWTSTMSGTFFSSKNSMELVNCISAPSSFEEIQVDSAGVYPESLTFNKKNEIDYNHKYQDATELFKNKKASSSFFPIQGTWELSDGTQSLYTAIEISVKKGVQFDVIYGKIAVRGISYLVDMIGLISHETLDNKKSLSFTVINPVIIPGQDEFITGFTGLFDIDKGTMKLVTTESRPVDYANKYNGVRMDESSYSKIEK